MAIGKEAKAEKDIKEAKDSGKVRQAMGKIGKAVKEEKVIKVIKVARVSSGKEERIIKDENRQADWEPVRGSVGDGIRKRS